MPSNKFKTRFPPARIKKIMQTDDEVGKVAASVPVIVSKSVELFTEILLHKSGLIATSRGAKTLSIDHIKQCVEQEQQFDFLREIVREAAAKAVGKNGDEVSVGTSYSGPPNGENEKKSKETLRVTKVEVPASQSSPTTPRKKDLSVSFNLSKSKPSNSSATVSRLKNPLVAEGSTKVSPSSLKNSAKYAEPSQFFPNKTTNVSSNSVPDGIIKHRKKISSGEKQRTHVDKLKASSSSSTSVIVPNSHEGLAPNNPATLYSHRDNSLSSPRMPPTSPYVFPGSPVFPSLPLGFPSLPVPGSPLPGYDPQLMMMMMQQQQGFYVPESPSGLFYQHDISPSVFPAHRNNYPCGEGASASSEVQDLSRKRARDVGESGSSKKTFFGNGQVNS